MATDDVIIRIRTAFEKGGIAAAEAELLKLAAAGARASSGTESFSSRLGSLNQGLRGSALNAAQFSQKLSQVAPEIQKASTALQDFKAGLVSGVSQGLAGFFAVQGIIRFTGAVKDAAVQYEKTIRALSFATGSVQEAGKAYEFARGEAERLSLGVQSTALAYSKFAAAAKGTVVSAEDVKTVFTGVLSASRALGLATTDVDRTFRAFTQIIAKGKVTAEEFRGQIGDALPVATAAATQALGVTTTEFSRLLDAGELTLDFLPKLGAELQRQFGGIAAESTDSLSAAIAKLDNAFTELQLTLAETGGIDVAVAGLNSIGAAAKQLGVGIEGASTTFKAFLSVLSGEAAGAFESSGGLLDALGIRFSSLADNISKVGASFESAKAKRDQFNEIVGRDTGNAVPGRAGIGGLPASPSFAIERNFEEEAKKEAKAIQEAAKEAEKADRDALSRARTSAAERSTLAKQALAEQSAASKEAAKFEQERVDQLQTALQEEEDARLEVKEAVASQAAGIQEQIDAVNAEAEALKLGGAEGVRYAVVQREVANAIRELGEEGLTGQAISKIRELADAEAALFTQREGEQQIEQANDAAIREFKRQSNAITETLTDAIFRGFENGKGIAENFKDTVVNLFKTLILRPVIEAVVKPVAQAVSGVVGSLVQSVLGGVTGGAGGGGGGGIFGSLLQTGASALVQQGIGTLAGGLGGTSTLAGFSGQVIPSLTSSASSLGGIAGSLTSSSASLTSIPGLLSSIVTGIQTPALAKFATIAAQELGTAVGGQAFGSAAAGAVGRLAGGLTNVGFGAIGAILAKQLGLGGGTIADDIFGAVGGIAGGAIGSAIVGTGAAVAGAAAGAAGGVAAGGAAGAAGAAGGVAAGASIGSVVPIIGTIIGAIIGVAAGSAIKATPPRGFESADFSSGSLRIRKGGKAGFDAGVLDAPVDQIIASILETDKALDLDLIKKKIKFFIGFNADKRGFRANIGGKDVDFGKEKDAQGRVMGAIFKEELLGALPDKKQTKFQKTVLDRAFAPENDLFVEQLKSIQKDLAVKERLKAFTKVVEFDPRAEKTKELTQELGALERAFKKLRGEARELGLDTKRAEEAFKKTKRRKLDEITGIQIQGEAEKITAQQQAFQLVGKTIPPELQAAGLTAQFKVLGIQFRELGLDTKILDQLLGEALKNLKENIDLAQRQESFTAQAQAFQLAGRQIPGEIQQGLLTVQFDQLRTEFERLGLDTGILTELFQEAVENIRTAQEQLADQEQARVNALGQAFQLAGRQVPIDLQRAGLQIQFALLGEQFQELGLDASILTGLLAEALANLEAAQEALNLESRLKEVSAFQQAFQLAGKPVPVDVQSIGIQLQFAQLGVAFRELGLDASILTGLLNDALAGLALSMRQQEVSAFEQAFQLAGKQTPIDVQMVGLELQFALLGQQFEALGLDAGILSGLFAEAVENLQEAQQAARQSALERAYQLAGEEVPKELQIAGIAAEFSALGELFVELGLDTGILGPLLQKAIDNINKAGEDLRTGGFIGFIDEFGNISEALGNQAANDSQFFGRQPAQDFPFSPVSPIGAPIGAPTAVPTVAAVPTMNPVLAAGGLPPFFNRPEPTVPLLPFLERPGGSASGPSPTFRDGGNVVINMNGPTVFDGITAKKFTREVSRDLKARGRRFG